MLLPLNKQPDLLRIFRSCHLENGRQAIELCSVDLGLPVPLLVKLQIISSKYSQVWPEYLHCKLDLSSDLFYDVTA